jgi:hypothetical protein
VLAERDKKSSPDSRTEERGDVPDEGAARFSRDRKSGMPDSPATRGGISPYFLGVLRLPRVPIGLFPGDSFLFGGIAEVLMNRDAGRNLDGIPGCFFFAFACRVQAFTRSRLASSRSSSVAYSVRGG